MIKIIIVFINYADEICRGSINIEDCYDVF